MNVCIDMKREELIKAVLDTLVQIQKISGREVPPDMDSGTKPIGGLQGFDSLNGLELTMMLPDEIEWEGRNLCVSKDGKRALNVGEIVDRLLQVEN